MIELKKINGIEIMVNPDLIRFIETAPDTILTFTDGEKLMVRDLPQEILQKIISFRRSFMSPTLAAYRAVPINSSVDQLAHQAVGEL